MVPRTRRSESRPPKQAACRRCTVTGGRGESSLSVHPPTHLGTRGCCTSGDRPRRRTSNRAPRPPGWSPSTRRAMAPSSAPSRHGGCASAAPHPRRPSGRWRRRTAACGACPRTRWAATRTPPSSRHHLARATRREIGAPGDRGGGRWQCEAASHGQGCGEAIAWEDFEEGRDDTSRAAGLGGAGRGATRTLWWRWWWERMRWRSGGGGGVG